MQPSRQQDSTENFFNSSEGVTQENFQKFSRLQSQEHEMMTPAVKRIQFGKQPLLNLFKSCSVAATNQVPSRSESGDDFMCPEKAFQFVKIQIDQNDDLEQKIHEWLDQEQIKIVDPYEKVADYYHNNRITAYNHRFSDTYQPQEKDSLEPSPPGLSLTKATSALIMSSSPIYQRRNKISNSENTSYIRNRLIPVEDVNEIEISEFQHA